MRMMVSLLLACHAGPVVADPPLDETVLDVLATLDLALDRAERGDRLAAEDCTRAYQRFESDLEPWLRQRVPPAEVLAIEYAFSRVGKALSEGRPAAAEVKVLAERLTEATGLPTTIAHR